MHLLLHADNSAWQLAVQLTRPIDSGHLRMHASYPESHLLVHCSRDSCANRSLGVSVPASLDVTPDSHTRKITAYLMSKLTHFSPDATIARRTGVNPGAAGKVARPRSGVGRCFS